MWGLRVRLRQFWGNSRAPLTYATGGVSDRILFGEEPLMHPDWIEIDPKICSGKPVIRGTRILVTSILSHLSTDESVETLRRGYPELTDEDVGAAIEFASRS